MMNKLTALSQPLTESETATTHKGGTTTTDEKGTVHKGKYGNDYQGDEDDEDENGKKKKKVAKPEGEKRGRGRPVKGADKEGNVMKPDFSAFGAKKGKDVKLKPWDKKATVKHSLKDWIENLDKALNEGGALTATPMPGATAIKNAQGQQVATAKTPAAAAMMTKGEIDLSGDELAEESGETGLTAKITFNREYNEYKVKFYRDGKYLPDADYFTNDKEDARGTAKMEMDRANKEAPYGMEESEQVNELSPDTLKSYLKKSKTRPSDFQAQGDAQMTNKKADPFYHQRDQTLAARKGARDRIKGVFHPKEAPYGMDKAKAKMAESKMSELDLDLKDPKCSDAEFKQKYKKTKAEMRASFNKKPADKKPEAKKTSKLKESILKESHETLKHIINKFKHEVKNFVSGEDLDQDLYDALYDYYCDMGEMPYGTAKARDGDPFNWVSDRFDRDVQDHDVPVDEAVNPMEVPAVQRKQAGVNFPVTMGQVNKNDSMSHLPNLKAAGAKLNSDPFGFGPASPPVQFEGWDKQLNDLLAEGMNVVANTGLGDAPDSVTISATDQDAQALLALVKSAGLGMFAGSEPQGGTQMGNPDVNGSEPGAEIEVVDDHDNMLSLIKRMTGQGEAPVQSSGPEQNHEVDETDEVPGQGTPTADTTAQEAPEQDQAGAAPFTSHDEGSESPEEEASETPAVQDAEADTGAEEHSAPESEEKDEDEEEEKVDEGFANSPDDPADTFEADIDFMQNVISGGMNGKKRTQSVGNPVTIADEPMRESTDLLSLYRKLSGL